MPSERAQRLSALQNAAIGSLAGMTEVLIQQPTLAIKNALQQGRAVQWTPAMLYRGLGVSVSAIAPINAVQFAANGRLMALFHTKTGTNTSASARVSDQTKLAAAATAGAISSVVCSPAELVMTLQQNTGASFASTVRSVTSTMGVTRLGRAIHMTMLREAVWCTSFLALAPVMAERTHRYVPSVFGAEETATVTQKTSSAIVGSILAGLVTVYATQPADTIKTVMQGEALRVGKHSAPGAWATGKRIWHEGGKSIQVFYRGAVPRGVRMIGAIFILGQARNFLEREFDERGILRSSAQ